jgi:YVTN family beta-propeller protein
VPAAEQLSFRILGTIEVWRDGRRLEVEGRKQQALLALLLLNLGRPVSPERLMDELWGERPPAAARKNLHVHLSRLRATLGDGSLVRGGAGYELDVDRERVDLQRFEALADEGRKLLAAGRHEDASRRLREGLTLWRGAPLSGLEDEPFVAEAARRLDELRLAALEDRVDADLARGDGRGLVAELAELVREQPFRERLHGQLMLALYRQGRQADALALYRRTRADLADQLGLEPGPALQELERSILMQDPALRPQAPSGVGRRLRVRPRFLAVTGGVVLADAADAVLEPVRGGRSRRWSGRAVVAAAVGVLALGAVVVTVLATRGDNSQETTVAGNAIGLIDAHGDRVRDQIAVDAAPTRVVYGYGAVWVANAYANTVSRIDPQTRSVRQTIPVGNSPSGIAIGGGGVWVANHDDGTVSWINPESNTVVREISVGHGPIAVAFGHRSVWVTNSDDRTVSRIDADTGEVVVPRIRTGAIGRGIVFGAGSVWVTDEATKTVVRIDPATNRVVSKATVGTGPADIVYGDGAVWVANELDGTVSEIDARTLAVRAAIPVAGSPAALAFGKGGLWASDEFGQRVVRIDTGTRRETAVLRIGNRPKGLAVVRGGVWVAVQASGTGHRGGRLVVTGEQFDSIDPALANNTDSFTLLGLAYDGLTAFDRVGGSDGTQLVGNLAEALPLPTDGGRSYTFRVRAGIRYSDGSLVRAQDFKRALERMFVLGSPLLQGSALTKVLGASSCKPKRPCDLSRGVIVSGQSSLTFRLSTPDPRLFLALTLLVPIPSGTPPKDIGTKPIPSTGPYAIETYVPGRQLRLVRNRHFRSWSQHARPNGYPDEIAWRIGVRPAEEVRRVIAGRADLLLNTVPAEQVEQLAARYPGRLHLIPQRATAFVFLNTRRAPFDDVRVRRALNYAVDRRKMAELHGGPAVAAPTCQTVPPTVPGYRRYCPYTTDPDSGGEWKAPDLAKARGLVAASGTKGQQIVVWTFPYFTKESRYLVSLLRRLGYRAQLREFPDIGPYFASLTRTPSVQAGFAGWFGTQLAADTFVTLRCRFARNWAHFCDRRFDRLVERLAAQQANDPVAGAALAARLDREIVNRAPWVPLFTPRFADFTSGRVGNYQANTYASSSVLLDQLWVR